MKLSHTRLHRWRRCRQQYAWYYLQKLPSEPSAGQLRGRAGHSALGAWYHGASDQQAIAMGMVDLQVLGAEGNKDRELMVKILQRYFAWARKFDDWQVLHTEHELQGKIGDHELTSFVDMIVRRKGKIVVVDHKFQRDKLVEGLLTAPQLSMYSELYRQNYHGEADTVMFNVVRTVLGGDAVLNPVVRTEAQLRPATATLWKKEVLVQAEEIAAFHRGGAGSPAIYRNQTKDCSWDCPFYQTCLGLDRGTISTISKAPPSVEIVDDITNKETK